MRVIFQNVISPILVLGASKFIRGHILERNLTFALLEGVPKSLLRKEISKPICASIQVKSHTSATLKTATSHSRHKATSQIINGGIQARGHISEIHEGVRS